MICILSDTHNNRPTAIKAANAIADLGPEIVVHCGDLENPEMLDLFAGLPMRLCYGNCDWDYENIKTRALGLGFLDVGTSTEFQLHSKNFLAHHGDNQGFLDAAIASKSFDYIFHGHTHMQRDERIGTTRVINPGALYRAAEYSFAVLDPVEDTLEFVVVPRD